MNFHNSIAFQREKRIVEVGHLIGTHSGRCSGHQSWTFLIMLFRDTGDRGESNPSLMWTINELLGINSGNVDLQCRVSVHCWLNITAIDCSEDNHDGVKLLLPHLSYLEGTKENREGKALLQSDIESFAPSSHLSFKNGENLPPSGDSCHTKP